MSGYQVLIPDSSRDMLPELTLPAMDALQQLGHTPVTLAMQSMRALYRDMRLQRHGGYELFLFYAKDLIRKGQVDFALSFGLSGVLEDTQLGELHYLPEEFELPGLLYLHSRDTAVTDRLLSARAGEWQHTVVCTSAAGLAQKMREAGIRQARSLLLGFSRRIYFPMGQVPADAAYPLQQDNARLANDYDVSFVGSWTAGREARLTALSDAGIRLAVFGDKAWEASSVSTVYRGPVNQLTELNSVMNFSRINLDLPAEEDTKESERVADYVSTRVPACLGSGSFLLAIEQSGLADYGEAGKHFVTSRDEELVACAQYWLQRPEASLEIAAAARQHSLERLQWTTLLGTALAWLELSLLRSAA